jgi:hypothetical protein
LNAPLGKIFLGLTLLVGAAPCFAQRAPGPYNQLIVDQVHSMPKGGQYSASRAATLRLQRAAHYESGIFTILPNSASPGYCSGATYLVFIKTIEALRARDALRLDIPTLQSLVIRDQRDGEGIWGRWNANGPGTARLFHELDLGQNFDDFANAQPGDFMKIFWSPEVGKAEHGHSVIYLGMEKKDGIEQVKFWSSNMPNGYGEKMVPRSKIIYAVFSRLHSPENLTRISRVRALDPYLARLLSTRSSRSEVRDQCGM